MTAPPQDSETATFSRMLDEAIDTGIEALKASDLDITEADFVKAFVGACEESGVRTVDAILQHKKQIVRKCETDDVPGSLKQGVHVLFGMMDTNFLAGTESGIRTAKQMAVILSYFLNPLDLVSDRKEKTGYLDDVVFMWVGLRSSLSDYLSYCTDNKLDPATIL